MSKDSGVSHGIFLVHFQREHEKSFYSKRHTYYEISWQEGLDIDDADDFEFALATRQILKKGSN